MYFKVSVTILLNKPPADFLVNNRLVQTDAIVYVYELKMRPELIQYYHAAAEFPTKPMWLATIRNNHYASWTRLNYLWVAKHFPE